MIEQSHIIIIFIASSLQYVSSLQDAKRKREEERQKQIRWREEHANAISQHMSMDKQHAPNDTGISHHVSQASTIPISRPSQRLRQKRWHRETKSAHPQQADSVETQDSNYTIDKFKSIDPEQTVSMACSLHCH